MKKIEISEITFTALQALAKPLEDTPDTIIMRLIEFYSKNNNSLEKNIREYNTSEISKNITNKYSKKNYTKVANKELVYKVCYLLSKFDHLKICPKLNQKEAFKKLSSDLNIKPNTLRGYRDRFDSHLSKERIGFRNEDGSAITLNDQEKTVLQKYENLNEQQIIDDIKSNQDNYKKIPYFKT